MLSQMRCCSAAENVSSNDFEHNLQFAFDATSFCFSTLCACGFSQPALFDFWRSDTSFVCRLVISFIEIIRMCESEKRMHALNTKIEIYFWWINWMFVYIDSSLANRIFASLCIICRYRAKYLIKTNPKAELFFFCSSYFCLDEFFPCIVMFFDFYTAIALPWFHELSNKMTYTMATVHCQTSTDSFLAEVSRRRMNHTKSDFSDAILVFFGAHGHINSKHHTRNIIAITLLSSCSLFGVQCSVFTFHIVHKQRLEQDHNEEEEECKQNNVMTTSLTRLCPRFVRVVSRDLFVLFPRRFFMFWIPLNAPWSSKQIAMERKWINEQFCPALIIHCAWLICNFAVYMFRL